MRKLVAEGFINPENKDDEVSPQNQKDSESKKSCFSIIEVKSKDINPAVAKAKDSEKKDEKEFLFNSDNNEFVVMTKNRTKIKIWPLRFWRSLFSSKIMKSRMTLRNRETFAKMKQIICKKIKLAVNKKFFSH